MEQIDSAAAWKKSCHSGASWNWFRQRNSVEKVVVAHQGGKSGHSGASWNGSHSAAAWKK